ncbi:hypothetical protein B0H14DRAFT_3175816 [Mycena olivaceomarginata]|nr:hypothetical protein B0H14DRAFT_3175816 [Mycena olivaceomarginata]
MSATQSNVNYIAHNDTSTGSDQHASFSSSHPSFCSCLIDALAHGLRDTMWITESPRPEIIMGSLLQHDDMFDPCVPVPQLHLWDDSDNDHHRISEASDGGDSQGLRRSRPQGILLLHRFATMGRALKIPSMVMQTDSVLYNIPAAGSLELALQPTFTFEGTAITIYGSVSPGNASISFSIDQSPSRSYSTPAVNSPIFHQVFWKSPVLADRQHTLVITQETTTEPHIIFLDYLMYETASTAGKTLFIDDNDTRIQYPPGWQDSGGSEGLAPSTFEDTVHFSESPGSSMSFTFQGHSVSIHGPIVSGGDGTGFNASVVIDTGPAFMITQSNLSPSTITFNNKLFASSGLAPGNHTIVVTPLDAHPFYVDYFLVESDASASATTTQPATQSAISPSPPGQSSAPKPPIAAIAGGSVGGLALLLLLLFGALMWRRRRRRQRSVHSAPGIAGSRLSSEMSESRIFTAMMGAQRSSLHFSRRPLQRGMGKRSRPRLRIQ